MTVPLDDLADAPDVSALLALLNADRARSAEAAATLPIARRLFVLLAIEQSFTMERLEAFLSGDVLALAGQWMPAGQVPSWWLVSFPDAEPVAALVQAEHAAAAIDVCYERHCHLGPATSVVPVAPEAAAEVGDETLVALAWQVRPLLDFPPAVRGA